MDLNKISDETLNAADVMDVDTFEELQQYSNKHSRATIPDQGRINGLNTAAIPNQGEIDIDKQILVQSNQIEVDDPDTTSTVVINRFPSGSSGASIPGMPRGTSTHETLLWSQCGPLFGLKKTGKSHIGWRCVAQVHWMWIALWQFQVYASFSQLFIVSNVWFKMPDITGLSYCITLSRD